MMQNKKLRSAKQPRSLTLLEQNDCISQTINVLIQTKLVSSVAVHQNEKSVLEDRGKQV